MNPKSRNTDICMYQYHGSKIHHASYTDAYFKTKVQDHRYVHYTHMHRSQGSRNIDVCIIHAYIRIEHHGLMHHVHHNHIYHTCIRIKDHGYMHHIMDTCIMKPCIIHMCNIVTCIRKGYASYICIRIRIMDIRIMHQGYMYQGCMHHGYMHLR